MVPLHSSSQLAIIRSILSFSTIKKKGKTILGCLIHSENVGLFVFVIFPFLRVSSPFDSLVWDLTLVRATASYLNEVLVAAKMNVGELL